ncbi:MAG: hypothetical protein D6E12_00955 [Desulfovibrio sp.]|nr:MAG: hypothetical protein D6E12_00955 [Desulfovibrio sp.]
MAETIDEITVNYEEGGVLLVKEIDKEILTRGAWTTILFRYQDFDEKIDDYGPDRYIIRRYRKTGGVFRPQSKFRISNAKQARQVVDALNRWLEDPKE